MRKSIWRKLAVSLLKLAFPAILLIILAIVAGAVLLVHLAATEVPRSAYLITPERLAQFTKINAAASDETWSNADKTVSRGWLLRGAQNAPAIVLLHRYGADRSWLLNLGTKLNAAGFTVLIPDLRGHGENPTIKNTGFGACEAGDLTSAIEFLRGLKTEKDAPLIGQKIGVYGVEIGAIAAALGAANSSDVQALALDSVPVSSSDVLRSVVALRLNSFASAAAAPLAESAAPIYFLNGCYKNAPVAESAAALQNRKVLLLAGADAPKLQASTVALANSFGTNAQKKLDLQPSGYTIIQTATPEQQTTYNNLIVEFFQKSLAN
jgi:pimeloyl-ACP methyl ester carboxylesterase